MERDIRLLVAFSWSGLKLMFLAFLTFGASSACRVGRVTVAYRRFFIAGTREKLNTSGEIDFPTGEHVVNGREIC
jgi:hypothetical protein